ncbi:MAG: ribonuclease HII [Clostridia bacterium]|nr:ribonuclease HII [Clostridia bacterium]MDD6040780.1 ribonuclease HII [Clostridia bacterium]
MARPSEKRLAHFRQMVAYDQEIAGFGTSLAGMDEAGRGPLFGNVVAACVIMPASPLHEWIDDSKKLSAAKREEMYDRIMETAIYAGVGYATPQEIDQMNILNATKLAMERAAEKAPATLCIVDAVRDLYLPFPIRSIIKGDSTSYHVAAASIVAKVTRDRQMAEYGKQYPQYGLERNMGYGTAEHIAALKQFGPTPEHRRTFIRNFMQGDVAE